MKAFSLAACALAIMCVGLLHAAPFGSSDGSDHAPQVALLAPSELPVRPSPLSSTPTPQYVSLPSAADVASNPFHFVGAHVRWTCRIDLVPSPVFADAVCGPAVAEPDPASLARSIETSSHELRRALFLLGRRGDIVLTGPVASLVHGDSLLIHGTVRRPLLGENAFGVQRPYPTVHIDAIIASP